MPTAAQVQLNLLIERAQSDLQACQDELGNYHLKKARCAEIVILLQGAIQVAQRDREGSRLRRTYSNINNTVRDWAFESTFKGIFRRGVHDLEAGIIPGLLTDNERLREALTASEEARELLQQESAEKDAIIADLRKQLAEKNNPEGSRRASNDSDYSPLPSEHLRKDRLPVSRRLPPKVATCPVRPGSSFYQQV